MENNKTISLAQKAKAVAITLIGAGIFSQGTFYFKEQNTYNIPRILYPVFELLGHVGLAVAMLILGLLLIFWAYNKWKNGNGKPSIFGIIVVAAFGLFFAILLLTSNKKTSAAELIKASEENKAKGIEKMQATDKPDFGIPEVDAHFAAFEKLFEEYKAAYKNENEHEIAAKQNAFIAWNKKSAELMQKLQTPEQKQQFAQYLGKLSLQWQAKK